MKIVFAFDVDGTLTISQGRIPSEWLRKLKEKKAIVGFAGNSAKAKESGLTDFDFYNSGSAEDLRKLRENFQADLYVHVGDLSEDEENSRIAGFTFIWAKDFRVDDCPKKDLKVIIIAGGFGTRMQPITRILPKALLPLGNRPLLDYLMDKLQGHEVYITTQRAHEANWRKWCSGWKNAHVIVEEATRSDELAGSVRSLYNVASKLGDEGFLVLFGNMFINETFDEFIERWNGEDVLVGLTDFVLDVEKRKRYGVVQLAEDVEDGTIVSYIEKPEYPKSPFVAMGAYLIPNKVIQMIPQFLEEKQGFHRFGEFISWLLKKDVKLKGHIFTEEWFYLDWIDRYIELWTAFYT